MHLFKTAGLGRIFASSAIVLVLVLTAVFGWKFVSSVAAAPSADIVYSIDGGITWSNTPTIKSGHEALVRMYYDNDSVGNITDAQMSTSLPAGFTLVPGSTRACLNPGTTNPINPASEMACNDDSGQGGAIAEGTVWSGDTLNIAPNAGVYGEATNAASGLMAAGKKRYLNLHNCQFSNSGNHLTTVNPNISNFNAGSNTSGVADGSVDCTNAGGSWSPSSRAVVDSYGLLGNRYLNIHNCDWRNNSVGARHINMVASSAPNFNTGTNISNTSESGTSTCQVHSGSWTIRPARSTIGSYDFLANRYLNLHQCEYTSGGYHLTTFVDTTTNFTSGTNASNTQDSTVSCTSESWSFVAQRSSVMPYDLLDTARGQGFVEYKMQTPALTEAQNYNQTATLTGTGTGNPTSGGNLTVEPDLRLVYSTDGGSTWTAEPQVASGANLLVRVFSHNERVDTLDNTQFGTTLPAGFSLAPGSTKTCLNPGTTDPANPSTELLCNDDTGQGGVIDEGAVWTGQDLAISPTAGLFGEATNLTSGHLAAGQKKYLNLQQCMYRNGGNLDWITVAIDDPPAANWYSGTNASNTADSAVDCGPGSHNWSINSGLSGVKNLELLGERYLNLHQCNWLFDDPNNGHRRITNLVDELAAGDWAAGTNSSNVADSAVSCSGGNNWTLHTTISDVQALDVAQNRYINLHQCLRTHPTSNQFLTTFIDDVPASQWSTGTNAGNTPDTALVCPTAWDPHNSLSDIQVIDLLDINRGQTFVEFEMTAPSPAAQTEYPHSASLTGTGTGDQSADDTITVLVDPGVLITQTGGSTDVTEGGTSDSLQVQLASPPSQNVTVTFTNDDGQLAAIPPLTFTPSNWDTPQPVGVIADDDSVVEGPHTDSLNYSVTSGDAGYNGLSEDDAVTVNITDNDTPGATVTVNDDVTSEDGDTGQFCVRLISQPSADVTIGLNSSDTNEATVPASVTILAADWDNPSANCVTVTGADDGVVSDGLTEVTIITGNVTSSDTDYNALDGSTIDDVTMYNQDNDPPGFAVDVIDAASAEDSSTATLQFRLLSQPTGGADVTIPLSVNDATEGTLSGVTDITIANADWNNGAANQVTVTGVDDDLTDGNIIYKLITGDPTSADPTYDAFDASAIVDPSLTNTDDDVADVSITETGGSTDVTEGGAGDGMDVVLDTQPAPGNVVVINIQPSPQLDTGGGAGAATQLTFTNANWDTPQTVNINANDDGQLEGDHTATVSYTIDAGLTTENSYDSVTMPATTVNITDDDTATVGISTLDDAAENPANNGHFRVALSKQNSTGGAITVNYSVGGTATGGSDFAVLSGSVAVANGASTADITVNTSGMDDSLLEGTETVVLTLTGTGSPLVSVDGANNQDTLDIIDDETQTTTASLQATQNGSETGPIDIVYQVTLTNQNQTGSPITFNINPSGGSAIAGADYTDFTGQTVSVPNSAASGTFTVTVADDSLVEGPETLRAAISNPSLAGLGIATANATASIADDDSATVSIAATDGSADEDSGDSGEFTISLSEPNSGSEPLTINYSVSGSAAAGADYAPLSGEVEIPVGASSATVTVDTAGYNDAFAEGNESVIITLTGTGNSSFMLGTPVGAVVVIAADSDTEIPQPQSSPFPPENPPEPDTPAFIAQNQPAEEPAEESPQEAEPESDTDNDSDGIRNDEEDQALNNGDGNGDGIPDREQSDVTSIVSPVSNQPVTLAATGGCQVINGFEVLAGIDIEDPDYTYPQGMFDYELACDEPGQSAEVTIYLNTTDSSDWTWRKFNRFGQVYATVGDQAQIDTEQVGENTVTTATYQVTDGGNLDEDGESNGIILDPSGPGISKTNPARWWLWLLPLPLIWLYRRVRRAKKE